MTEDLEAVARAWWEGHRLATGSRAERERWNRGEPRKVARGRQTASTLVQDGGERAVELVVALLDTAPDGSGASLVGAGPLEDLVTRHGNALAGRLDELARRSAAFRRALAAVWIDDGLLNARSSRDLARWIRGRAAGG